MTDILKQATVEQLTIKDAAIFQEGDYYVHIYGRGNADWGIDIYFNMDESALFDATVLGNGSAEEAVEWALLAVKGRN